MKNINMVYEEIFIGKKKVEFESLFKNKKVDENLTEFLMYLTDTTNRKLWTELEKFNNHIDSLKENGFFDRFLED